MTRHGGWDDGAGRQAVSWGISLTVSIIPQLLVVLLLYTEWKSACAFGRRCYRSQLASCYYWVDMGYMLFMLLSSICIEIRLPNVILWLVLLAFVWVLFYCFFFK